MPRVRSKDGSPIGFDRAGGGPAVILVDGALCHRGFGPMPKLAPLLAEHFTMFTYDRRGRGDSGDADRYAVEREVEDLEALIEEAGGSASMLGISSGAVLALDAVNRGLSVERLAVYEPPFIVDDARAPIASDYRSRLDELISDDRRGDAVKLFMKQVGIPSMLVAVMPVLPNWSKLKAVAPTLRYDAAIMGDTQAGNPLPADRWSSVTAPTMVLGGGKSPAWMQHGVSELADLLPNTDHRLLDRQTHQVKAKVLAPALVEFFAPRGHSAHPT
jgi:pimeloyl-ACP methyl ester carboxylesterase